MHVKLPKELSGGEGGVRSDLGDLQWNDEDQCYHCVGEIDVDGLQAFIAGVIAEVTQITEELCTECESGL